MKNPTISELWKYPVKSCGGFQVNTMGFTEHGPNDDRRYTLIDEGGVFVSQRTHPKLSKVKTTLLDGNVRVTVPGVGDIVLYEAQGPLEERRVIIHGERCVGFRQYDYADELFSTYLGKNVELVRHYSIRMRSHSGSRTNLPVRLRFADGYPITVLSARALFNLNQRLVDANEEEVGVERFRPNIVVEGCLPHDEDGWKAVSIGSVSLRFEKLCSRCTIPDVNPHTGIYNERAPVMQALKPYRGVLGDGRVYFSSNFAVELRGKGPHTIAVDDPIRVDLPAASSAA